MALQIWLPLNGNLDNYGLDGSATITNSGATINTSGKIGSCYAFDGTQKIAVTSTYLQQYLSDSSKKFSLACWIYLNSDETDRAIIFGNWNTSPFINWELSAGCYQLINTGTTSAYSGGQNTTVVPKLTWTHLALVYDGSYLHFYFNGELKQSVAKVLSMPSALGSNLFYLGGDYRNDATRLKGRLNDFRLYDHALSPKEVKLISQGLVLHYPLNRDGFGCDNIIPGTSATEIQYTYPSTGYNDKFSATTSIVPSASQYVASFWAKSTVNGDIVRMHWYSPNTTTRCESSQGVVTTATDGNIDITLSTEWKYYWVVYTQSSTTAVKHFIFPRMFSVADQPTMSGTGVVSIKGLKLEEGNIPTPWVPNSNDAAYTSMAVNNNVISDASGYGHNGTKNGTFSYSGDSPRYSVSTYFTDYNRYITAPLNGWTPISITLSCWIKCSNKSPRGNWHIPLSLDGQKAEISIGTSGKARIGFTIGNTRYTYDWGNDVLDGDWHLITNVFDGSAMKMYVDGVLVNSINVSGAMQSINNLYIGRFGNVDTYGSTQLYESDVRIYATALSADDVQKLYRSFASVTSNGSLLTYSFSEL